MSKEDLAAFLEEMRRRHADQVDAMDLPEGTDAYVAERIAAGDVTTLLFMLKLGYLMGLQTGYAAGRSGDDEPDGSRIPGPLQA